MSPGRRGHGQLCSEESNEGWLWEAMMVDWTLERWLVGMELRG